MKQINYIVYLLALCMLAFTACDREEMDINKESNVYGKINLASMKLSVNVSATPLSRAESIDVSNYIVDIYSEDGSILISEWKYSEMPEIFMLKVGKYKVVAHAPNTNKPAFDEPYCEGSRTFEIAKDQVTNIETIKCELSSIMVTIKYEDEFSQLLGDNVDIEVKVGGADGETIHFKKDETRSAYFHAAKTGNVVDVNFLGTLDGEDKVSIKRSYTDVPLGAQLIVTYKLKDANGDPGTGGNAAVALRVDTRCDIILLDGSVLPDKEPGIEDFPTGGGGEEPGITDPTITSGNSGLDLNSTIDANTYDVEKDGRVVVNLLAPRRIQNIIVEISSSNEDFGKAVIDLFGSATFDLANPPVEAEYQENLITLGFKIGDELKTTETVPFDITEFVPLLTAYTGLHQFKITVKDTSNASATVTLKLKANQ